jgi:signal transduction histidine kinase
MGKKNMIKKLRKRIFLIIMISLSIVVIGIIAVFAILNYKNTIDTASLIMDRFIYGDARKNATDRLDEENDFSKIDIEGLYYVDLETPSGESNISNITNKTIKKYSRKLKDSNKDSGIIGDYIYKIKKQNGQNVSIVFMESEETILHLKVLIIVSIVSSFLSLIIIYIIAKQLSEAIVEPVEETFEKQKQFISDASHELKTPLAVIEANADVLENEVGGNKWLKYIQNEIESMNKLINELLLLAKIENIDNVKDYKTFDLSKEIEIITSMFESMAYEKNVKLTSKLQENISMNGNKEDTEHILSTLIDNAIKHTDSEKEVIVEAFKEKNNIIIQVKNMGQEIPQKEREKIFERFYRIDKSRNRNEKRYGLGLAIAKSTVEKYRGNINVDYKDGFTIFKVTIPV